MTRSAVQISVGAFLGFARQRLLLVVFETGFKPRSVVSAFEPLGCCYLLRLFKHFYPEMVVKKTVKGHMPKISN